MDDIETELLALADRDASSADEREPSPKLLSSSTSPYSQRNRSITPPDMARKGTAQVVKKGRDGKRGGGRASAARRRRASFDEDGEVSTVSSTPSPRSAPMSQSVSDSDYEGETPIVGSGGPMFPYQSYYYSAKDKAEIDDLPEVRREEILAERSGEVEKYQQNQALQRLLASRAKEAKDDVKKRKIGATDLDDGHRKSSRQRTTLGGRKAGERDETIEAYKKTRAEKGKRDEQRLHGVAARKGHGRKGSSGNSTSSIDAYGEYDSDAKISNKPTPPPKDEPLAELKDIQRATIGRLHFASVVYNPGFDQAVVGCYARICVGPSDRVPGTNEYRVARIEKIVTGRPYTLVAPNGRYMPVEKYILASHGRAQRAWGLLECSMDRITDQEWRRYRITMANDNIALPTQRVVNGKLDELNRVISHRFTDVEITDKLNQQDEIRKKVNKTEERKPIIEKRDRARARGDYDEAQKYEDELADIVPMKLAFNTTLNKTEVKVVDKQQEALMELNRRAARIDDENVRKAQVAESRARRPVRPMPSGPKIKLDDLFEGSDGSRAGTPFNGILTPRPGTPANDSQETATSKTLSPATFMQTRPVVVSKSGLPVIRKSLLDEEIKKQVIQNLDLNIDIEI